MRHGEVFSHCDKTSTIPLLITLANQKFSNVFSGYRIGTLARIWFKKYRSALVFVSYLPSQRIREILSNLSIRVSFLTDAAAYFDSALTARSLTFMWDKVFKSGSSKIFGRQPLKNLKGIWSA